VPLEVVERAVQLARMSGRGEDLVAACSALSEREVDELRIAESAARKFLTVNFDESMGEVELMDVLDSMLGLVDEECNVHSVSGS
jgi:DNA mismatch repair protein MSH5